MSEKEEPKHIVIRFPGGELVLTSEPDLLDLRNILLDMFPLKNFKRKKKVKSAK